MTNTKIEEIKDWKLYQSKSKKDLWIEIEKLKAEILKWQDKVIEVLKERNVLKQQLIEKKYNIRILQERFLKRKEEYEEQLSQSVSKEKIERLKKHLKESKFIFIPSVDKSQTENTIKAMEMVRGIILYELSLLSNKEEK